MRAANGMEAFCTPSQLRDMEFFTQSVRTQWEVGILICMNSQMFTSFFKDISQLIAYAYLNHKLKLAIILCL